jgi:hypothetical protein
VLDGAKLDTAMPLPAHPSSRADLKRNAPYVSVGGFIHAILTGLIYNITFISRLGIWDLILAAHSLEPGHLCCGDTDERHREMPQRLRPTLVQPCSPRSHRLVVFCLILEFC